MEVVGWSKGNFFSKKLAAESIQITLGDVPECWNVRCSSCLAGYREGDIG